MKRSHFSHAVYHPTKAGSRLGEALESRYQQRRDRGSSPATECMELADEGQYLDTELAQ